MLFVDTKKIFNWITHISNYWYPPFGIFTQGKYELINNKTIVTVFANFDESSKPYLEEIKQNNGALLWPNLTNKEILYVLKEYKSGNLFWLPELRNEDNATLRHLFENDEVIENNVFFSELWIKDKTKDYSNQLEERLFFGLSHNVLVLTKLNSKQLLSLANYGSDEDIKIVFRKDLFEEKFRKLFSRCKIWLIDKKEEIIDYFFNKNN